MTSGERKRSLSFGAGDNGVPTKQRRMELCDRSSSSKESETVSMESMSADALHHILSFFFSEEPQVDEESILSSMLVCKKWKTAATAPALWKIPQQKRPLYHPTRNSLLINASYEFFCGSPSNSTGPSSFIGFVKLGSSKCDEEIEGTTVFRVMERSTRKNYLLCASPPDQRSNTLMSCLFSKQGMEGILEGCDVGEGYERFLYGTNCRRLVRVHPDSELSTFSELASEGTNEAGGNDSLIHLQQKLVGSFVLEADKVFAEDRLSPRSWAILVDWIFEIGTCFDLDYRVLFLSMELFRNFVDLVEKRTGSKIPQTKYQRVASATLLIASKCYGEENLRPVDLVWCSDKAFTEENLLSDEGAMLTGMLWRLNLPTIESFVVLYQRLERKPLSTKEIATTAYLSSLALQSQVSKKLKHSRVACAIIIMSRYWLKVDDKSLWSNSLAELTGFSFEEVCKDVVTLSNCLAQMQTEYSDLKCIKRLFGKKHRELDLRVPLISSTMPLLAFHARSGGSGA